VQVRNARDTADNRNIAFGWIFQSADLSPSKIIAQDRNHHGREHTADHQQNPLRGCA